MGSDHETVVMYVKFGTAGEKWRRDKREGGETEGGVGVTQMG